MALTPAQADAALKQLYPQRKVSILGYENNVFLSLVPKDTGFYGKVYDLPLKYGGNTGGAHTFSTAQANKAGGLYGAFLLTRVKDYALGSIETEAVQASMSDIGSFVRLAKSEVDGTIAQAGHMLNVKLFRNSGGAIGQVGSTSTTTLTLKDISDIVHFEKGMVVVSSDTDGTSGASDGQEITITKVDRDLGTLTAAVTWTAGGNFSDNDYIFRSGDFGASLSGLDSWLPASAPGATSFFGQDRSLDVTRLGGVRIDGSSMSISEALQAADTRLMREGGKPSHVIMNVDDHGDFRKSLGSNVIYDRSDAFREPMVGFRSIRLAGCQGDVQVIADRDCPKGVAYMLEMSSWVFASIGSAPKFLNAMGEDETLWEYNADAVEYRIGYYGQLGCRAPGHNARITLPTG